MFGRKKFKALEAKIELLERRINALDGDACGQPRRMQASNKSDELDYKDVMDEWLNGRRKENK